MKLPKPRGMTQRSNEELRWWFQDSGAAMGQRAGPLMPSTGGGTPNYDPSKSEQDAAARWRRIARALAELTRRQRDVLEDCYTAPTGTDQGHGAGDGAVLRACAASKDLRELQARCDAAKPGQKVIHRERLEAARGQIARDIMGEVKVAHRDYVAARRRHRAAERELMETAQTAKQRSRAEERAEPSESTLRSGLSVYGRNHRAIALAEAMEAIGQHPLAAIRAAVAEEPRG